MTRTILFQRIDEVLTKNGLYVCHGNYRPKEAAKREVGDSSEMLCFANSGWCAEKPRLHQHEAEAACGGNRRCRA